MQVWPRIACLAVYTSLDGTYALFTTYKKSKETAIYIFNNGKKQHVVKIERRKLYALVWSNEVN